MATGTLTLGAADLLANTADVSINSGATLKLGGNDTIRSLVTAGTLDKTNTNDTLTAGTYALNAGAVVDAKLGAGTITSNGTVSLNNTATATTITVASGTLTLGAADLLANTADVSINSGATLKLGGNDTIRSLVAAGTLDKINTNDTLTAGTYALNDGAVVDAKLGAGTINSNGAVALNGASAATTVSVATGTLTLGAADLLADTADVSINSGATLKLGGNDTIRSLTAAGTLAKTGATDTLTATSYTLNNGATVNADLGAGTVNSNGTVALNGAAAATTINVVTGTLTLGAADLLDDTADVSISSGATLKLGGNDTIGSLTTAGTLSKTNAPDTLTAATYALNSGAAVNAKLGLGTVTSNGAVSVTDDIGALTVHVASGTLTVGNGGNTGSLSNSATVDGAGRLAFNRSDNFSVGTKFTGGVAVAQAGGPSSTLTLTNTSNDHSGGTSVTSGTLALGGNNVLGSGAVSINGGTLDIATFSDTVASLTVQNGNVNGTTGTLTATTYTLNNGATVNANLGAGTINSNGAVALNGASAATTVSVATGTLTLGAADLLADTADVSINSGATLKLGGNDTIRSLTAAGTLAKTGATDTLTATSYTLNNGATVNADLGRRHRQ